MQAYFVLVKVNSNSKELRSFLYWKPLLGNVNELGSVVIWEAMQAGTLTDEELHEGWEATEVALEVHEIPGAYEAQQALKSAKRGLDSALEFIDRLISAETPVTLTHPWMTNDGVSFDPKRGHFVRRLSSKGDHTLVEYFDHRTKTISRQLVPTEEFLNFKSC